MLFLIYSRAEYQPL